MYQLQALASVYSACMLAAAAVAAAVVRLYIHVLPDHRHLLDDGRYL